MTRTSLLVTALVLIVAAMLVLPDGLLRSEPGDPTLMEAKTARAQDILKHLAMGDLAAVGSDAEALEKATIDAGLDGAGRYADYAREFLRVTRALRDEARANNLAGSYYQFSRLTALCFSCHEHIRGVPAAGEKEYKVR